MSKYIILFIIMLVGCSNADFTTKHGLDIYIGEYNRPTIESHDGVELLATKKRGEKPVPAMLDKNGNVIPAANQANALEVEEMDEKMFQELMPRRFVKHQFLAEITALLAPTPQKATKKKTASRKK